MSTSDEDVPPAEKPNDELHAGQPEKGYTEPESVIITQPKVLPLHGHFGLSPKDMECPHCNARVTTSTKKKCGTFVWMMCGLLCLIGIFLPCLWFGCCFIPFCVSALYDVKHTCPQCHKHLGTHTVKGFFQHNLQEMGEGMEGEEEPGVGEKNM